MHPNQEALEMMNTAGFVNTEYQNMTGGIVALHIGEKNNDGFNTFFLIVSLLNIV